MHAAPEGPALELPIMDKVVPHLLICHCSRQVTASGTVQGVVKAGVAAQQHGDCFAKPEAHACLVIHILIGSSLSHLLHNMYTFTCVVDVSIYCMACSCMSCSAIRAVVPYKENSHCWRATGRRWWPSELTAILLASETPSPSQTGPPRGSAPAHRRHTPHMGSACREGEKCHVFPLQWCTGRGTEGIDMHWDADSNSPGITVPIAGVCPIHMLVLEHEGVDGVSLFKDDARRPHLRMENCVCHVVVAGKDSPVILQGFQPHLQDTLISTCMCY